MSLTSKTPLIHDRAELKFDLCRLTLVSVLIAFTAHTSPYGWSYGLLLAGAAAVALYTLLAFRHDNVKALTLTIAYGVACLAVSTELPEAYLIGTWALIGTAVLAVCFLAWKRFVGPSDDLLYTTCGLLVVLAAAVGALNDPAGQELAMVIVFIIAAGAVSMMRLLDRAQNPGESMTPLFELFAVVTLVACDALAAPGWLSALIAALILLAGVGAKHLTVWVIVRSDLRSAPQNTPSS